MRYLIITYDEYRNIPYIAQYEQCLRKNGHCFDIVLWNRSGQSTEQHLNHLIFNGKSGITKVSKILPFLKWRRYVRIVLRTNSYDRLIVLTTIPGVLLFDQLLHKYCNRFWLDIRDYTYENIPIYRLITNLLVTNSAQTSVSSPGFLSFLPENDKVILTHNLTNANAAVKNCTLSPKQNVYILGFVGGIRYPKQNKQLLTQLANHPHFRLKYVGKTHPGCELRPFCDANRILNVDFLSTYDNTEKPELYRSIDLINSIYGNESKVETLALPNKLYDCVLYKKPILVSSGTYLANLVEKFHLGIALDLNSDCIAQKLDQYISTFNKSMFESGCEAFLELAVQEQQHYIQRLESFCCGVGNSEANT